MVSRPQIIPYTATTKLLIQILKIGEFHAFFAFSHFDDILTHTFQSLAGHYIWTLSPSPRLAGSNGIKQVFQAEC